MALTQSTPDPNPSLLLHEVLAAEFVALHGEPAPPGTGLKDIWAAVHRLGEKRAALCISGGGIRSATFALGVLQGLARCGLLKKFHYLSTVSGGGYIGSWLTAWILRADHGLDDVVRDLATMRPDARPNPEATEIQNLRSYSNYLSPRLGLLSADTWTLVAIYLRNLILNWLVLIPLLAAAVAVPWIYTAVLMINPPPDTWIPFWLGLVGVVIGTAYIGANLPSSGKRTGNQTRFLCWCLLPVCLGAIFMTIFWAWFTHYGGTVPDLPLVLGLPAHSSTIFIWVGIGVHLASWLGSFVRVHGFRFLEFLAVVLSGAVGGVLLWVAALHLFPQPTKFAELYSCFAVPLFVGLFLLALVAFAGLSSRWTGDEDREWWARANGWLLIVALGWIVVSGLVIFGGWALGWAVSAVTGVVSGIITMLAGHSGSLPANEKKERTTGIVAWIFSKASSLAALVFIAVLAILITLTLTKVVEKIVNQLDDVDWNLEAKSETLGAVWRYVNVILYAPWWVVVLVALGVGLFGVIMAGVINPNRFSLHAMYRDRLIRAYLGASNRERKPNPFTGFDPGDNPKMHAVWSQEKSGGKLMPVINIALNLVHGEKLAWQERKATSFTVSPLHCGSAEVGYRKTNGAPGQRYGSDDTISPDDEKGPSQPPVALYGGREGISLGTALAISGAAASPNMGYHSSPLVTFILTLLNVRLGAWLGNPGPHGHKTFHLGYPRFGVRPIIAEAFGLTNAANTYVYLSDGGHFENLGLYEMVLRRCHYIVVSDAGQDPLCSFADLGDAVRKIRIDLGIPIEFTSPISIFARSDEKQQNLRGRVCARGKIRYSVVDGDGVADGVLVYIKPACYGEEPRDIYEYFKNHPAFPHEPTSDQFFSESQFESYRMLGVHAMEKICSASAGDFESFLEGVDKYLASPIPDKPETPDEPETPTPCCK